MVRNCIVKQSGGEITLESAPGSGAKFSVWLPVTTHDSEAPSEVPTAAALRGTETILLVEDDDAVRSLVALLLPELGYKVVAAADAAQAIRLAGGPSGAIDLLLTDVMMPGMDGSRLAAHLRQLKPDLKVVFMSGYIKDEAVDRIVMSEGVYFIQKPFTIERLAQSIRAALDSKPSNALLG